MSVAYFIALDNEDVEFDSFVNGKSIAHAMDELSDFCRYHDLKTIENFYSQDVSEIFDELDDSELTEQEEIWYDADEGIKWATALIGKLKHENPSFLSDAILEDLNEYLDVFRNAKKAGAKWHLELDF